MTEETDSFRLHSAFCPKVWRPSPVGKLTDPRTSLYDATFFPDTYRRYCHLLGTNQAYVVSDMAEEHFGTVTLTVNTLHPLSSPESAEKDAPLEQGAADPYTEPQGPL